MPLRDSPEPEPNAEFWKQKTLDLTDVVTGTNEQRNVVAEAEPLATTESLLRRESRQGTDGALRVRRENPLSPDISTALTYGLELVRCGAMLVADEGRLRVANRAALAILNKKDGLWLSEPGLTAERASDTRLLLRLLREAIASPELGEPKDSPIMLSRKFARTSLIVRVFPGPGLSCWPDERTRAAMLMLYDQDMGLDVNISLLIRLYGLTRGEAALAASLMRGKSVEDAAEELFISHHTARTHLKRIFMKTDTHRQTELVLRAFPAML